MDSLRIFVVNLPYDVNESSLRAAAERFGTVREVRIPCDPIAPARSRGFGFIVADSEHGRDTIIAGLNNMELGGRTLRAEIARPREARA